MVQNILGKLAEVITDALNIRSKMQSKRNMV